MKFGEIYRSFCMENPAEDEPTIEQVLNVFTDIVEATGMDPRLLCVNYARERESGMKSVEECVAMVHDKTAYLFPRKSETFVVSILQKCYTSEDYEHILRGNYEEASGDELVTLAQGFSKILYGLGYPEYVVEGEYDKMIKRFCLINHLAMDALKEESDKVMELAADLHIFPEEDQSLFLKYMKKSLSGLRKYMLQVYSAFSHMHSEELYEMAEDDAETIIMEYMEKKIASEHESEKSKYKVGGKMKLHITYDEGYAYITDGKVKLDLQKIPWEDEALEGADRVSWCLIKKKPNLVLRLCDSAGEEIIFCVSKEDIDMLTDKKIEQLFLDEADEYMGAYDYE